MDHGPLLALLALLLELEVLLKDGGEAVPLQHARLMDHLVFVGRQSVQVVEEGDIVSWRGWEGERKWKLLAERYRQTVATGELRCARILAVEIVRPKMGVKSSLRSLQHHSHH